MAFVIGASLALVVGIFATVVGLDRERAFYATVMIVIAWLYSLFAVMAGSTNALLAEMVPGTIFMVAAVVGFRRSMWLVAGALVAHGVFDWLHPHLIANPGVPVFWPAFCGSYDLVAGAYLAWLVVRRSGRAPSAA